MTTPTEMTTSDDEVLIRREGRAGRITMNRPKALNALTYPMIGQIAAALDAWHTDPAIGVILLDAVGDRALCAGGDVISLYESHAQGAGFARRFWRDEYHLNAAIHRYPKPFVAIMDGIVMGGGIGLSAHARHRIVTERSMLAMPETGIGLVPDVGGTWLLARAQGELGTYLGLTGARMSGSDAIQAGFAQSYVTTAQLNALKASLIDPDGGDVDGLILAAEEPVPPSPLAEARKKIDRWFAFDTIEAISHELTTTTDPLAQKIRNDLKSKSPLALKATLAALRSARQMTSLEAALVQEYRLVVRLFERGEFNEGVRALLVDKDRAPKWQPPSLAEVTPTLIAELLAPFPPGEELQLPAR